MIRWTKDLLKKLKQHACYHAGYLDDLKRRQDGQVECPCFKCGKVLVANYGLAMNITWGRKPS